MTLRTSSNCFGWNLKILLKSNVPSAFTYGFRSTTSLYFFRGTELPLFLWVCYNPRDFRKGRLCCLVLWFVSIYNFWCRERRGLHKVRGDGLAFQFVHLSFRGVRLSACEQPQRFCGFDLCRCKLRIWHTRLLVCIYGRVDYVQQLLNDCHIFGAASPRRWH